MKVSVCITVFNEQGSMGELLDSLLAQTQLPSEVVVVDGGSTDNTAKIVKRYQKRSKLIRLQVKKGTIAVGRNEAVRMAKHEIIAMTDAGCVAKMDWLARLTKPFNNQDTQVVAGFYDMPTTSPMTQAMSVYHGVHPKRFGDKFMPSTRSVAFTKSAWKNVGGFDETLRSAGEDTKFFYSLVKKGVKIVRVKEARVVWGEIATYNLLKFVHKTYSYAVGDAQVGIGWDPVKRFESHNIKILFVYLRYLLAVVLLIYSSSLSVLLPVLVTMTVSYAFWAMYKWRDLALSLATYLWMPVVQVVSDLAVMAGFARGLFLKGEYTERMPLYIFLHIHKTGGTTLNKHIEENFGPDERLEISHESLNISYYEKDRAKILKAIKQTLDNLDTKRRKRLKIIYGHIVPYGAHELFSRECRYFTLIRRPEDRLVSSYNYYLSMWNREKDEVGNKLLYEEYLLVGGKKPSFESWFTNKFGNAKYSFGLETLSTLLVSLGYVSDVDIKTKSYQDLYQKFWFVGTTDSASQDALFLYSHWGVNKFFINQNVSAKYFTNKKLATKLLYKKSASDWDIFAEAKNTRSATALRLDYKTRVGYYYLKKSFMLPFTQLLFDPRQTLWRARDAFLRK